MNKLCKYDTKFNVFRLKTCSGDMPLIYLDSSEVVSLLV